MPVRRVTIQRAERAGFEVCTASDHLHPWNSRPGHAAFLWSWLGAAMQATTLDFRSVRVSTSLEQHAEWAREYVACGVDELIFHNVATNQAEFIDAFGEHVLPPLKGAA